MKLTPAEYARIKDPQLKATIDACNGQLPPLAGAGGNWQMFVPPQAYVDETPTREGVTTYPAFALTGGSQGLAPTLLSRWEIGQVYVPCGFYVVGAGKKEKLTVTARLAIFRNGDLVWSEELRQELTEAQEAVSSAYVFNGAFANNPNQPIILNASQQLTMQLSVFFGGALTFVSRRAYLSQQVGKIAEAPGNNPETLIPLPGTLTYDEQNLSGHREL